MDTDAETYVGPSLLPSGLLTDITPEAVKVSEVTSQEDVEKMMLKAAKDCKYTLKKTSGSAGTFELFVETPSAGEQPPYHDIPLWGSLVVYDTPEDAESTLTEDDRDDHRIRLILVATNKQLAKMLAPGKEICRHRAALYLRVAKTCPLYYLQWEEFHEDAVLDIVSQVPHRGNRQRLLDAVTGSADGRDHGVKASVRKQRKVNTTRDSFRRPLFVSNGEFVVGAPAFRYMYFQNSRGRHRVEQSGDDEEKSGDDEEQSDSDDE